MPHCAQWTTFFVCVGGSCWELSKLQLLEQQPHNKIRELTYRILCTHLSGFPFLVLMAQVAYLIHWEVEWVGVQTAEQDIPLLLWQIYDLLMCQFDKSSDTWVLCPMALCDFWTTGHAFHAYFNLHGLKGACGQGVQYDNHNNTVMVLFRIHKAEFFFWGGELGSVSILSLLWAKTLMW